MRIERDRIGTFDPGNAICILRSDGDERANTTVDVKPELLLFGQFRESLQIIYRAGIYRPGRSYHAGGLKICCTILRDSLPQGGYIDPKLSICRYVSESLVAQPKRFHCLTVTTVKLIRAVEAQRLLDGGDTVFAHINTRLDVSRHIQANDVGHRAAAHQRAAGRSGKADHLLAPAYHLLVHKSCRMVATAEVRALDGR